MISLSKVIFTEEPLSALSNVSVVDTRSAIEDARLAARDARDARGVRLSAHVGRASVATAPRSADLRDSQAPRQPAISPI